MSTVYIYGFQGRYSGDSEYEWNTPEVGDAHKFMLFLAQETDEHEFELAEAEIGRFGVTEIENLKGNPLKVEVLNTDTYRGFSSFYEAALDEGSCLVFYPEIL